MNCEHDIQNHSTRYGPIYWCNKCKRTPEEIKEEESRQKQTVKQSVKESISVVLGLG
jgi:hypothetical protein